MVRDGEDPTEINALAILGADPDDDGLECLARHVRELASLERLRLAAKVAQAERNMNEKTRARRWTKDSGETITHGELISELNKAQKIEIDVAPLPVKEQARVMARQGMSISAIAEALGLQGIDVPSKVTLRKMVRDILAERAVRCVVCGAEFRPRNHTIVCESIECQSPICPCGCGKRGTSKASKQSSQRGRPWQCGPSSGRMSLSKQTPEQRRAAGQKANASRTPEGRSAVGRKMQAARTPEQRRESVRKGKAKQTPEQRRAAARKASAALTPKQKREIGQKGAAASNAARKARRAAQ